MYILRVYRGGMAYNYGPFPDRKTAVDWAIAKGYVFETEMLYPTE